MLLTLFICFLMKFSDCALSTAKTVFLVKGNFFMSSVLNSLAAALFIFVADLMANAENDLKIYIAATVFLANLLGGYLPPLLIDKLEKDRLYVFNITSASLDEGFELADTLRALDIPVNTTITYNKKLEKVVNCTAYASTKEQSKTIHSMLNGNIKYNIIQAI